jgi:hypothetical protein
MAIFGDLSDMSTPEVLNMLGPRTGKLLIRPAAEKEYELHLREGVIHCLKDNGFSMLDTSALRQRVTDLLGMRSGSFEFSQTLPSALEYEVKFTRNEIWQIAASLTPDSQSVGSEHIPDSATRFRLKNTYNADLKLPEDILDFMQKSHDLLFSGCSAGELANALNLPVAQVQIYFQRLRSLDRITPVRAYAANYGSYSPPAPAPMPAAAVAPSSFARTAPIPAAAKPSTAPAPRPKQNFVRRLLSALSFGGK